MVPQRFWGIGACDCSQTNSAKRKRHVHSSLRLSEDRKQPPPERNYIQQFHILSLAQLPVLINAICSKQVFQIHSTSQLGHRPLKYFDIL